MTNDSPYAGRPWLRHYDYWVRPSMTFPGRPLTDILATTALDMPDAPATSFLGAALTFLELKRRSDALAASLVGLGIGKGGGLEHLGAAVSVDHDRLHGGILSRRSL